MADIPQILGQLAQAEDPTEVIKANVLQDGGLWVEPGEHVAASLKSNSAASWGLGPVWRLRSMIGSCRPDTPRRKRRPLPSKSSPPF